MRETTITTDKNNFVFPPRKPRSDRGDVVFTSCSRCFPIDTQAIRNKILDLAIRGKLTEQLPEDGSAEELYRQIQAKKSARTKGGKRKEETSFQKIGEAEIPFAIPKNWKWIRLNDLGIFCGGKTPSMANHSYWKNGSITWVTSKDMKQKYIHASEMMITEEASRELTLLPAGTVLFVVRSGILRRLFPVAILKTNGTINQDLKALQLFVPEMCEFVYCLLKCFESTILFKYTKDGTTVNNIVFDSFLTMPVPLPPPAEQRRIVEKIDQAFSILDTIDALQAQYADNLTVLKNKLLEAAIQGKLVPRGPESWKTVELGDIAESVNVGIVIRPSRYYVPQGEGTPAFRNCNIQQGFMDDSEWVWLSADAARENPRAVVKSGDILIARSGTPGNCCIVPEACNGWGAVDIVIVRLRQDLAAPRYVKAFICSPTAQKAFLAMSRGVALSHLGATAVASLPVSLPSLAEQKRIAAKLEELLPRCEGPK